MRTDGSVPAMAADARPTSYLPALDGLRGVAVVAVLFFHAGFAWAEGGYLGVSTFFTLSGYLVTTLLISRRGRFTLDLRGFWARRGRRLVPAAAAALAGILAFGWLVADASQLATLRGDVLAAMASVLNWRFVLEDRSYSDLFATPSPVLHFWSLSVEVQCYLLLPLGLWVALRRGSLRGAAVVFAGLAVLTAVWSTALWTWGRPFDRIYYGTDVRVGELLAGAALALFVASRATTPGRSAERVISVLGLAALAALVALYSLVPLGASWTATGGLLVVAVISSTVVLAGTGSHGPAARTLSFGPLVGLGRISYAVYLFHWPLFLWLRQSYGWSGWSQLMVGGGLAVVLATASWLLLEDPVRRRRLFRGRSAGPALLAATSILVLVTVMVSLHPPPDPFAGAAAGTGATGGPTDAAEAGVDRPLEVLLVGDDDVGALAPALSTWSGGSGWDGDAPPIDVATITDVACGAALGEVGESGSATCAGWVEEWGSALEGTDPDVVVLSLADLDVETLLASGGKDAPGRWDGGTGTWIRQRLDAAVELLGSGDAPVVVVSFPHPVDDDGQPEVDAEVLQVLEALRDAALSDPDIVLVEDEDLPAYPGPDGPGIPGWRERTGAVLAPVLVEAVSRSAPDLPRVMVAGDSVAWFLGEAYEARAADAGDLYAWNTAVLGCGVGRGGEIVLVWGVVPSTPECDDWPARWDAQLRQFDPDVVIMHSGLWDLTDRRPPGWDDFGHVGDVAFDDWLVDEYVDAVDLLSSRGARVIWLTAPCHGDITAGALAGNPALESERLERLNEVVLPELVERRPDVELLDLFGQLCPDGELTQEVLGFENARPDEVHFSAEVADALVDWIGTGVSVRQGASTGSIDG